MSTIAEIESAISRLAPGECRELAAWLSDYLVDLEDGLEAQRAEQESGEAVSHEELMRELGAGQ